MTRATKAATIITTAAAATSNYNKLFSNAAACAANQIERNFELLPVAAPHSC